MFDMTSFFSRRLPKPCEDTTDTKVHRKVSRLDLFFDLIYVLLFRDLFYFLRGDVSLELFQLIFIYFLPARLVRHGYNYYVQRFEETTIRHRMLTFLLMALIGVYSFSIHKYGLQASSLLLYAGAGAHFLLGYLFMTAARNQNDTNISAQANKSGLSHMLFAGSLVAGIFLREYISINTILLVSCLAYILYLFVLPLRQKVVPKVHSGYLGERYGLFIIIVLAELIYGLISGLSDVTYFDRNVIFVTIGGFSISLALWRLYFDVIGHNPIKKSKMKYVIHRSLLHLPLSLLIIYLGGMFLHMIYQVSSTIIQTELMFITGLFVILIFFIIGLLSFFHKFAWKKHAKKLNLPEHLPGYAMMVQVVVFPIILRILQISTPGVLIFVLLLFLVLNIIAFHYFFDPLDADETFE